MAILMGAARADAQNIFPPPSVAATPLSSTSIKLTWTQEAVLWPEGAVVGAYFIWRGDSEIGNYELIHACSGSQFEYIDTDLTPNRRYFYLMGAGVDYDNYNHLAFTYSGDAYGSYHYGLVSAPPVNALIESCAPPPESPVWLGIPLDEQHTFVVPYRRWDAGLSPPRYVNNFVLVKRIARNSDNPFFELNHARTTSGQKVKHYHAQYDYDHVFGPPHGFVDAFDGARYWRYFYEPFFPQPDLYSFVGASMQRNCVAFAYDQYFSPNTMAKAWIMPEDAGPYRAELQLDIAKGINGSFPTLNGDRCDNLTGHVWVVLEGGAPSGPASKIIWINAGSPPFIWEPNPPTNNSPKHPVPTPQLYDEFAIYRKPQ